MNKQHFALGIGTAAAVAAMATGCAKTKSDVSSLGSSVSAAVENLKPTFGSWKKDAPQLTTVGSGEHVLDSKVDPSLKPYLATYSGYKDAHPAIFGEPLTSKPTPLGDGGEVIQFNPGEAGDKTFHALTKAKDAKTVYAVWGQIGDGFQKSYPTWGFPVNYEEELNQNGVTTYIQQFQHGEARWTQDNGLIFTSK